jgi:hypothetical protein
MMIIKIISIQISPLVIEAQHQNQEIIQHMMMMMMIIRPPSQ